MLFDFFAKIKFCSKFDLIIVYEGTIHKHIVFENSEHSHYVFKTNFFHLAYECVLV